MAKIQPRHFEISDSYLRYMFDAIERFIYVPTTDHNSLFVPKGYPIIVYCYARSDSDDGRYFLGSTTEKWAIHQREHIPYGGTRIRINHCSPYSEEAFYICEQHIEKRKNLETEYLGLTKQLLKLTTPKEEYK